MYLGICAAHSVSKKKFLVIQMGWNVALFSGPVAAPPSDRKNCGVQPNIRPRGYKTFFMLNSLEHEILNAHKYENINKVSIFQAQISLECYFSCS